MKSYSNEADINFLKKWGSNPKKGNELNLLIPLLIGLSAGGIIAGYYLTIKYENKLLVLTKSLKSAEISCAKIKDEMTMLSINKKAAKKEKISEENQKV